MFGRIRNLFQILTQDQQKKLLSLQVLVVFMAFSEVASVAAIGAFMALVGNLSQLLETEGYVAKLYLISGIGSPRAFLFWIGIAALGVLVVASAISIFTTWRLSLYAQQVGADLSSRLYRHYMQQPWLFHASGSSSQLTNKIVQETTRITNNIIQPLMQINAKSIMAFFIAIGVFLFNPLVAFVGITVFGVAYFLLYRTIKRKLSKNGSRMTETNRLRFKLMNEGFGGIKDTLLLGRQADFNQRFESASYRFGRARGINQALSTVPRYVMELIAFSVVIFLVLYLLRTYDGNLNNALPVLSIYALAGFKLLPAFQAIYSNVTMIRGNLAAFDGLEKDFKASRETKQLDITTEKERVSTKECIELEGIFFTYPGKEEAALKGLSMSIPVNQNIGIVGASGSGKSTVIDVLLGLIEPEQGVLKVDGEIITADKKRAWQNNIGFVAQTIFLSDASILENIAFGLPINKIDKDLVRKAAALAHLDELINDLPEGLSTRVGERGIQLSGGQRQRIGIARALYGNAEVLVFDEATSALDGITEKLVMDSVAELSGSRTIIMIAHRLSTVRNCHCIYFMKSGHIVDKGTYAELLMRNDDFKAMVAAN